MEYNIKPSSSEEGKDYFFLQVLQLATASFKFLPTLNLTTFLAGTLTSLPVLGTLAVLAALSDILKVPKPTKVTLSPFVSTSPIVSSTPSSAASASFLVKLALAATRPTNSAFVIATNIGLHVTIGLNSKQLVGKTIQEIAIMGNSDDGPGKAI